MKAAGLDDRAARRANRERSVRSWLLALLAYALPESDAEAMSTAPAQGELRLRLYDGRTYTIVIDATEEEGGVG